MNILFKFTNNSNTFLIGRFAPAVFCLFASFMFIEQASAQVLKGRILGKDQEKRDRRPNDDVEGTIWEYKSTKYKSTLKKGEEAPVLSGRIRIEGNAVFKADKKIKIGGENNRRKKLKDLASGKGAEIDLGKQVDGERIGEYRKMSNGKYRFDFNDEDGLHGVMIAWPKDGVKGVWLADYSQKDGSKTTGKWLMELRAIKD